MATKLEQLTADGSAPLVGSGDPEGVTGPRTIGPFLVFEIARPFPFVTGSLGAAAEHFGSLTEIWNANRTLALPPMSVALVCLSFPVVFSNTSNAATFVAKTGFTFCTVIVKV